MIARRTSRMPFSKLNRLLTCFRYKAPNITLQQFVIGIYGSGAEYSLSNNGEIETTHTATR